MQSTIQFIALTILAGVAIACTTHDPCENPDYYYSKAFSCEKPEPTGCENPAFEGYRDTPGYYAVITDGVTLECDTRPKK